MQRYGGKHRVEIYADISAKIKASKIILSTIYQCDLNNIAGGGVKNQCEKAEQNIPVVFVQT